MHELATLVDTRGFKTVAGRLRRQALCELVAGYAAQRVEHPELAGRLSSAVEVKSLLAPLWSPKATLHPVFALLLVEALREQPEVKPQLSLWESPRQNSLKALKQSLDKLGTAAACARQAQVSVTTAVVHALAAGKKVKLRPKKLTPALRQRVSLLLQEVHDVPEVLRQVGLSSSTVYRVMKANPELAERYHDARRADEIRKYQRRWQQLQGKHPSASKTRLRQAAPSCYAFLYRNCRSWLHEHSPGKRQRPLQSAPRIRIPEGADAALANAIREAAASPSGMARNTVTRLLKAAGKADGRMPSRRAAPLTRSALDDCVEGMPGFVARRLAHAVQVLTADGQRPLSWKVLRTSSLRPQTVRKACVDPQAIVALTRKKNFKRLEDGSK